MISRRHIRTGLAVLLPLMVLRALLPTGYMPVAEDGRLRMVMCSAGLSLPGGTSEDAGRDHRLPGANGDCLFAHATAAVPPVLQVIALAHPPLAVRIVSRPTLQRPAATGPPRITAARAPPALS